MGEVKCRCVRFNLAAQEVLYHFELKHQKPFLMNYQNDTSYTC